MLIADTRFLTGPLSSAATEALKFGLSLMGISMAAVWFMATLSRLLQMPWSFIAYATFVLLPIFAVIAWFVALCIHAPVFLAWWGS